MRTTAVSRLIALTFLVAAPIGVLNAQEGQTANASGWKITVERVQTVFQFEEDTNFPFAAMFPNGDINLHFSVGRHTVNERAKALISHDRGRTWGEATQEIPAAGVAALPDGTVVSLAAYRAQAGEDGSAQGTLRRSPDGGVTWERKTVPIKNLPAGTRIYGHRSMVAMPDGSLLWTYYALRPGETKYHCGLLRSADRGDTWERFSEIASDPNAPDEGYCEPVMVRLGNGDLLAMMRTGSASPMFQARSTDGGRTWSAPEQVMDHGVCPDLCLMESGVLVCSYGRPNVSIMFSYDGTGTKWEDAQVLYGARGGRTADPDWARWSYGSSYTTLLELEPGLLMLFYDQSGFVGRPGPGPLNEIRVAYIRVQRP
jgi:hypothetical protein